MSTPPDVRVTAVTVSADSSVKKGKRLASGEIQIDHVPYKLIRDKDGSLCQQFPSSLILSSKSTITVSFKTSQLSLQKSQTFDIQRLFGSVREAGVQDLSMVQEGIRVTFTCRITDTAPASRASQNEAVSSESQSTETLIPTTESMLDDCSRFRILVIGKTGVGKSRLIQVAFGIQQAHVSDFQRGKADIHEGLISPVNKRFILHDSVGIEPGDNDKYQIVKDFIQSKQTGPLADRLHAVWFCIQTPYAGGRLLEAGAEDFFRSKQRTLGAIPLIIVYTKFDLPVNSLLYKHPIGDLDDESIMESTRSKVQSNVHKMHNEIIQLTGGSELLPYATVSTEEAYKSTLRNLIDLTHRQVGISDTPEAHVTSVLTEMAQRIDPLLKIRGSIDIGRRRYWKTLGSSPNFAGHTIWDCLSVIHADIIAVWNFNDLDSHLLDDTFKQLVIDMVKETRTTSAVDPNKILALGGGSLIAVVSGILATIANPAAPIVLPIVASLVASAWLFQVYRNGKDVQQIFMTFIVDLTHIMETLFILSAGEHNRLTRRAIKFAYTSYHGSGMMRQAHHRIQQYRDLGGPDAALKTIESLILPERDSSAYVKDFYEQVGKLDLRNLKLDREPDEGW